jgi:hypothetical protein
MRALYSGKPRRAVASRQEATADSIAEGLRSGKYDPPTISEIAGVEGKTTRSVRYLLHDLTKRGKCVWHLVVDGRKIPPPIPRPRPINNETLAAAARLYAVGELSRVNLAEALGIDIKAADKRVYSLKSTNDWPYNGWQQVIKRSKSGLSDSEVRRNVDKFWEETRQRQAACQALEGRFFERKPKPPQTNAEACAAMIREWRHRTRRTRPRARTREVAA